MNPPFDLVFRAPNHNVRPQDQHIIKQYICDAQAELVELQNRRRQIEIKLQEYSNAVAPVNNIDDDVLQQVFVACLPEGHNATMTPLDAPILLCHVCARWRRLAFSTARLWCSLHVYTQTGGIDDTPVQESVVEMEEWLQKRDRMVVEWIKRAKACKLSLSFGPLHSVHVVPIVSVPPNSVVHVRHDYVPWRNTRDLKGLLLLLSDTAGQWDEVQITVGGTLQEIYHLFLQSNILRAANGSVLRDVRRLGLWLDVTGPSPLHEKAFFATMIIRMDLAANTALRELALYINGKVSREHAHSRDPRMANTIISTGSFLHLAQVRIPMPQLRHLDLTVPFDRRTHGSPSIMCILRPEDVLHILHQCPRLVSFSADVDHSHLKRRAQSATRVINRYLTHITFYFASWGPRATHDFLGYCTWPALSSLKLRHDFYTNHDLTVFVEKVGSTLTCLNIHALCLYPEILPFLPALVRLELEAYGEHERRITNPSQSPNTPLFLNHLTPRQISNSDSSGARKSTHCCPLLQYLTWDLLVAPFSDLALSRFIRARADSKLSPVPLKMVHIVFRRRMQVDLYPDCSDLMEKGLDLKLVYLPEPQCPQGGETFASHGIYAKLGLLGRGGWSIGLPGGR